MCDCCMCVCLCPWKVWVFLCASLKKQKKQGWLLTFTHTHTCTNVCTCAHTLTCTHTCMRTCTCMHTHTYTHTQTVGYRSEYFYKCECRTMFFFFSCLVYMKYAPTGHPSCQVLTCSLHQSFWAALFTWSMLQQQVTQAVKFWHVHDTCYLCWESQCWCHSRTTQGHLPWYATMGQGQWILNQLIGALLIGTLCMALLCLISVLS